MDGDFQAALDDLKLRLCTAAVLVLPDFDKPFAIYTDAYDVGLGAALVQTDENGCERAVAYASRTLSKSEHPYSTLVECLGVIWGLEHFRPYVEGNRPQQPVLADVTAEPVRSPGKMVPEAPGL